jgi:hypothetical protein
MSLLRIFSAFQIQSDNYFLKPHELEPLHSEPILLKPEQPFWLLAFLLTILALLMAVRIFYRKSFSELANAFFSFRYTGQLVRDENILLQRTTIILTLIFTLTLAMFFYQSGELLKWNLPYVATGFKAYLFFALLISAIYTIKFLVLKITGFIFDISQEMETYIFNVFLINNMFGLLLLPVVVINFLYPAFSITQITGILVLIIATIFFLYRLVRGVFITRESGQHSPFYLFFYLCALEIAPLLVLFKVLIQR